MNEYFFGNPAAIIAQWPLATALVTLFYTFVHILPGNLIRCYIFRKYLRYPLRIVLSGLIFLLLLEFFCQLLYGHIFSSRLSFIFHWIYFSYLCAMTRVHLNKQIALIIPLGLVWFWLLNIAYNIEYTFPLFQIPFLESGICLLLLFFVILIPLKKYGDILCTPLLASKNLAGLWSPLALISLAALILSILASPFNESRSLTAFLARLTASFGALMGSLIALYAARQVFERQQMNSILSITEEMRELEKEHFSNISEIEKNTHKIQTELNNYAGRMLTLLAAKRYDEIREQADRFLDCQEKLQAHRVCANELVNALLSYWQPRLDRLSVTTRLNIQLDRENPIDPVHMTAILGNLLRNAAEALARVPENEERQLKLNIVKMNGYLILTLDNSFNGEIVSDEDDNLLSAKRGFAKRGVGLDSIRYSVEHYHGEFSTTVQDRIFEASILLPVA